ncbi:unnamed protein product [Schistosoma curassoni]|nr:unnamed protein product [Schistosoma curassoni]
MKVLGICIVVTLVFSGINCVKNKKVKCYRCTDCPNPFDKTQITELANCNFCRTVYTYRDEDNYRIAKDCVASCVPQDRRGGKAGLILKTEEKTTKLLNCIKENELDQVIEQH